MTTNQPILNININLHHKVSNQNFKPNVPWYYKHTHWVLQDSASCGVRWQYPQGQWVGCCAAWGHADRSGDVRPLLYRPVHYPAGTTLWAGCSLGGSQFFATICVKIKHFHQKFGKYSDYMYYNQD